MATLETFLTSIADAIREKKGTSEPIKGRNFTSEILSIQGGGSLNLAYGTTPPSDKTKIWLQCEEPTSVEVQNYLGECAVSNVANWGAITNPVAGSNFYAYYDELSYYSTCYIGNNQIAIVGYNHIRIYDLTTKAYIEDYTISVGDSYNYTNILLRDNVLYFGYYSNLYKFDLSTQTLTKLYTCNVGAIKYIFFTEDNCIKILDYYSSSNYIYIHLYNLDTNSGSQIYYDSYCWYLKYTSFNAIRVGNYIYNFTTYTNGDHKGLWKFNIQNNTFYTFSSYKTFIESIGWTRYTQSSTVYDGERYIYLLGGNGTYNGVGTKSNLIIKYDTLNDSFELLDQKIIGTRYCHFSVLVDNRIYMFGGFGRTYSIDYFDLSYPLTQNNAIITTNTINTDNALPLINTDKLKLNSNIASAYKGNAENLAEKVNAYYWDGSKWVGINCEDYVGNSSGTGGGLGGGGDATTDPEIPTDKPVEM